MLHRHSQVRILRTTIHVPNTQSLQADQALRPLATSIFYLLTPDEPNGYLHMNKSAVSALRITSSREGSRRGDRQCMLSTKVAQNTPSSRPDVLPRSRRRQSNKTLQSRATTELLSGHRNERPRRRASPASRAHGGLEDVSSASDEFAKDRCGCLITEVVFPGFVWGDHAFLTLEEFNKFWDDGDAPEAKELVRYVKKV